MDAGDEDLGDGPLPSRSERRTTVESVSDSDSGRDEFVQVRHIRVIRRNRSNSYGEISTDPAPDTTGGSDVPERRQGEPTFVDARDDLQHWNNKLETFNFKLAKAKREGDTGLATDLLYYAIPDTELRIAALSLQNDKDSLQVLLDNTASYDDRTVTLFAANANAAVAGGQQLPESPPDSRPQSPERREVRFDDQARTGLVRSPEDISVQSLASRDPSVHIRWNGASSMPSRPRSPSPSGSPRRRDGDSRSAGHISRIGDSRQTFRRYRDSDQYRGILFTTSGQIMSEVNERSWGNVQRFELHLQARELHAEARRRSRDMSPLEQYLELPSDLWRAQVNEEIRSANAIKSKDPQSTASIAWSLMAAYADHRSLLIFLVGTPENPSSRRHLRRRDSPPSLEGSDDDIFGLKPYYGDFDPYSYDRNAQSRGRSRERPPPRPRYSYRDPYYYAYEDGLGTGLPTQSTAVSVYKPKVSIPHRYVDSYQSRPRDLGSAYPSPYYGGHSYGDPYVDRASRPALTRFHMDESREAALNAEIEALRLANAGDRRGKTGEHDGDPELEEGRVRTEAPISFNDASGRDFIFPWYVARTWKGMRDLIENAFLDREAFALQVFRGHYDLIGPDGQIIMPDFWEDFVEPGATISMRLWPTLDLPGAAFPGRLMVDDPIKNAVVVEPKPTKRFKSVGLLPQQLSLVSNEAPTSAPNEHQLSTPDKTQGPTLSDRHEPANAEPEVTTRRPSQPGPGSKYVPPLRTMRYSKYLDMVESLAQDMPHLTNVRASEPRNPFGGRISCWDMPTASRNRPRLISEMGPRNWSRDGGLVARMLQQSTTDVKLRTVIVEDLCPDLIEAIGSAIWPNPEFFEEHLSQSGYKDSECQGIPPRKWNTNSEKKEYMSIKWHRPVHRNDLKPHSAWERHVLCSANKLEWTSDDNGNDMHHTASLSSNIFRQCWSLTPDPDKIIPTAEERVPSVWEERATIYRTTTGSCPLLVILLDPLPQLRHHKAELEADLSNGTLEVLYGQAYNRNSSRPMWTSAGISAGFTSRHHARLKAQLGATKSTQEDLVQWLYEASQITPDKPDLTLLTALLWVIHRDTIGFLRFVADVLEHIGLDSTDDYLIETRLAHWRGLISRFQVELPELRTSLDDFTELVQKINETDSTVSEFVPDTLGHIESLMKQNEKSYAALRADMGVLESRKGIAEAKSVSKLTELATFYIPLTFCTGLFSMQIKEFRNPAPAYAFIIAAVATLTVTYAVRLTMRSTATLKWKHVHWQRVRKFAKLSPGSQVPARAFVEYATRYAFALRTIPWRRRRFRHASSLLLTALFMIPILLIWTHQGLDAGFKSAVNVVVFLAVVTVVVAIISRQILSHRLRRALIGIVRRGRAPGSTSAASSDASTKAPSAAKREHSVSASSPSSGKGRPSAGWTRFNPLAYIGLTRKPKGTSPPPVPV